MIIKNKELKRMLRENGRQYTLTMYINRYFHMTKKQLNYVLEYGVHSNEKEEKK